MAEVNSTTHNATDGMLRKGQFDVHSVHPRAAYSALVILTFSVLGNGLVVAAFIRDRRLRVVFNTFVVTLAIADIVMSVVLISEVVGISVNQMFLTDSTILCRFFSILVNAIPTEQLIITHMMCNDRHKAFLRRLAYSQLRQLYSEPLRLAVTWAFSFTASCLITDIVIVLHHGKFTLCYIQERPLYVSQMAFVHAFLLLLLLLSLIYVIVDFRKHKLKKTYSLGLTPDLEPTLGGYIDNKTSSQCLIPRSPVPIYRDEDIPTSPDRTYQPKVLKEDTINSGDCKSPKDVKKLRAANSSYDMSPPTFLAMPYANTVQLEVVQENTTDPYVQHIGSHRTHYKILEIQNNSDGVLPIVSENGRPNLAASARASRTEKRLGARRSGVFDRCKSETRRSVRILDAYAEKNAGAKRIESETKGSEKLEVEASSNSQDEWSHSSCSFSEEEPTDIPMPRFKPRTDSLYTLRSCMSITEEATNLDATNSLELTANADDLEAVDKEFKNASGLYLTFLDSCGTTLDNNQSIDTTKPDAKRQNIFKPFDSSKSFDQLPILQNASSEVITELEGLTSCNVKGTSCSQLPTKLRKLTEDKMEANSILWDAGNRCNNYFGTQSELKPTSSSADVSFELSTMHNEDRVATQDTFEHAKSNITTLLPTSETEVPGNKVVDVQHRSSSNMPIDIDVATRDWITFYNIRQTPEERLDDSAGSLPSCSTTSQIYVNSAEVELNKAEKVSKISDGQKLCLTDIFKVDDNQTASKILNPDSESKIKASGDNVRGWSQVSWMHESQTDDNVSVQIAHDPDDNVSVQIAHDPDDNVSVQIAHDPTFDQEEIFASSEDKNMATKIMSSSSDGILVSVSKNTPDSFAKTTSVTSQCQIVDRGENPFVMINPDSKLKHDGPLVECSYKFSEEPSEKCIYKVNRKPRNEDCKLKTRLSEDSVLEDAGKELSENNADLLDELGKKVSPQVNISEAPEKNEVKLTPLQLLESLSISKRAYLAEIGLYHDILMGHVTLDPSLIQPDPCPQCPYCQDKEKSMSSESLSEISSSEASSMADFSTGTTDKLARRSLLYESQRTKWKLLADASSNNTMLRDDWQPSSSPYYSKETAGIDSWCTASSRCPVFAIDMPDHFRIRSTGYSNWTPALKKAKKLLSFEMVKSYDPELSILVSLLLVIVLQLMCWLPITCLYIYYNISHFPGSMGAPEMHYILLWCTRMALQPIVYAYYSRGFRMNFIYFLSCSFYNSTK
ncbi:uncharacterized protein LOC106066659 isoform X2 [Biomphalaria glabrata]|uniref:Uncharacterized protein LOC106066659 isoform X2 n=1 Tax=Biomphalaria glabrata TaxID=6526 RepID=A0A9W3BFH9_BIOGL|nr:uncharacterized protein LOC106066659 isoform X2 [Biomphalaria glabrata]